jgi:hypothetical protein
MRQPVSSVLFSAMSNAMFVNANGVGDTLYLSVAWNAWFRRYGEQFDTVYLNTLNNHVTVLYHGMGVPCRMFFGLRATEDLTHWDASIPVDTRFVHWFDPSAAFRLCQEHNIHLAEGFAKLLGVDIAKKEDKSHLRPVYQTTKESELQGAILVAMFSSRCKSRFPDAEHYRMMPFSEWKVVLHFLRKAVPGTYRFVGAAEDRAKTLAIADEEWLTGVPLDQLAAVMKRAKLFIGVDGGMTALATSQNTPTFVVYPDCYKLSYTLPVCNPKMGYIQAALNTVRGEVVAALDRALPSLL